MSSRCYPKSDTLRVTWVTRSRTLLHVTWPQDEALSIASTDKSVLTRCRGSARAGPRRQPRRDACAHDARRDKTGNLRRKKGCDSSSSVDDADDVRSVAGAIRGAGVGDYRVSFKF